MKSTTRLDGFNTPSILCPMLEFQRGEIRPLISRRNGKSGGACCRIRGGSGAQRLMTVVSNYSFTTAGLRHVWPASMTGLARPPRDVHSNALLEVNRGTRRLLKWFTRLLNPP